MKDSYRIVQRKSGWWAVECRPWWCPFYFKTCEIDETPDKAIESAKQFAVWREKQRRFIPTIIDLGPLP